MAIPMATNHGMARGRPSNLQKPYFEAKKIKPVTPKIGVITQTRGRMEVDPRYIISAPPPMNQVENMFTQRKIKGFLFAMIMSPRATTLAPRENE